MTKTDPDFAVTAEVELGFDREYKEIKIHKGDTVIILNPLESQRMLDTLAGKLFSLAYTKKGDYSPSHAFFANTIDGSSHQYFSEIEN